MKQIFMLIRNIIILISFLSIAFLIKYKVFAGEQKIYINEIMFDPVGEDLGYEWIELYNPNDTNVIVDGWKIQVAGTTFKDSAFLSGTIPSKSIYTICEDKVVGCNSYVTRLSFQNGGGATDGIQILNHSNVVIDQILYDTPNINNLVNMEGLIPDKGVIIGKSGESLGLMDNQYLIFQTPTIGKPNIQIEYDEDIPNTGASIIPFILSTFSAILLVLILKKYLNVKVS